MNRAVRLTVRGRVQGVFFRASAQEKARALGVVGWARNCADGTVELQVEGPPASVQQMIDWCHEGPPSAQVSGVDVQATEFESAAGFEIRH